MSSIAKVFVIKCVYTGFHKDETCGAVKEYEKLFPSMQEIVNV